jgi:glycosyltransferase involved in cell wall biosynthesis
MREILYVWNYRDWGGAQIYFMSLMKEAKKRYQVTAVLPENSQPRLLSYLEALDVPTFFLALDAPLPTRDGVFSRLGQKLTKWRRERQLTQQLLKRRGIADSIVHIDLGFWQSFLPLYRLSRVTDVFMTVHTGLPYFTGLRGLRWKIKGELISRQRRFHLLASNQEARDSLRPYISKKKFRQVEVIYSGFDPDEMSRVAGRKNEGTGTHIEPDTSDGKPLLITVGQFIERKGCWILLQALRLLKESGKELSFVWLSTSIPETGIMRQVESYGLFDSFRIVEAEDVGNSRDDLLAYVSLADMFVLASLQEGLPIALVEAMALGLPCIATDVNAIPEAIVDGQTGILIPPSDPEKLAAAISLLIDEPEEMKRLGAAAKKIAYGKFNEREISSRMLELYDVVWKSRNQQVRISH